jgi:AbrB family looped-hinge helix DNA binding protein
MSDMAEAIVSSKYQIVIPKEARKALGLKPGDKLVIVLRGGHLVVMRNPKSDGKALRSIGRGLYGRNYLKNERESCD